MRLPRVVVRHSWWLMLPAVACSNGGDATTSQPGPRAVPATITIASGNDQEGTIGDPLPVEVHARVSDAAGQPIPGIAVHLEVTVGDGSVPKADLITDTDGEIQTVWTQGQLPGANRLEARVPNLPSAVATANASTCDLTSCADERIGDNPAEWKVLDVHTYDGSGEAMHPDVVRGGTGLGWFWLAVTPYPNSDVTKENPSLFQSRNGRYWRVPRGLTNPVVTPGNGYLSDPDLVSDRVTHRIWMYYRRVAQGQNIISLVRSYDGVRWEAPVEVLRVANHEAISPTVVHGGPDSPWVMWVANTGTAGCISELTTIERRTSSDGIHWSAPTATDLVQPGWTIWHLDIEWVPARAEYWALYNTYPAGSSCATTAVHFARSHDGITWTTYPSPVITTGVLPALRDVVYRSSMLVNDNADSVRLYVSGARFDLDSGYTWRTAAVSRHTDELFATVAAPRTVNRPADLIRRDLPPPEPDVGATTGPGSGPPAAPPSPRRIRQ